MKVALILHTSYLDILQVGDLGLAVEFKHGWNVTGKYSDGEEQTLFFYDWELEILGEL